MPIEVDVRYGRARTRTLIADFYNSASAQRIFKFILMKTLPPPPLNYDQQLRTITYVFSNSSTLIIHYRHRITNYTITGEKEKDLYI